MTFKIEELTKTPDFELRCNIFVAKVWDLSRRYNSISLMAFNETKYVLDPETANMDGLGTALAAFIMKVGEIDEDLVDKLENKTKAERTEEEKNSAFQNRAEINIFGVGDGLSIIQAELLAEEIEKLAQKLGGELKGEKVKSTEPHRPEIHKESGAAYHEELRSMDYIFQ